MFGLQKAIEVEPGLQQLGYDTPRVLVLLDVLVKEYGSESLYLFLRKVNDFHILSDTVEAYGRIAAVRSRFEEQNQRIGKDYKHLINFPKKLRLHELHNTLMRISRTLSSPSYKFGKQQERLSSLDTANIKDYQIAIPVSSEELVVGGDAMSICVGTSGYDGSVYNKCCHILFLKKGGEFKYCVQLKLSGEVTQFMGKYNERCKDGSLVRELENKLTKVINKKEGRSYEEKWQSSEVIQPVGEGVELAETVQDLPF
jgi:hypothetical protein